MQSLTSLLALLSLTAAQSITFSITDFNFTGSTNSPNAIYSLSVSQNNSAAEPVLCYHTTATDFSIEFFPETSCGDESWTYSWDAAFPGSPDAGNAVNITHKGAAADGKDLQARLVLSHDAVQEHVVDGVSVEYLNQGYGTGYGVDFDLTASEI